MDDAVEKGAQPVCGGNVEHEMGANFFAPTLLSGVTLDMRISQDEIFGPVVAVMKFKETDEALAISNRSAPTPLSGACSAFHRVGWVSCVPECLAHLGIPACVICHKYSLQIADERSLSLPFANATTLHSGIAVR